MALRQPIPDAAIGTLAELKAMNARPHRLFDAPLLPLALPYGIALMRVPTPTQARALLAPADPEERRRRSAVFYRPKAYRARARLPIGQHDRMEEYLLADGSICETDTKGHDRHFPIHLKSIRLRELRLGAGEIADLSCRSAEDWPWLHYNEEVYLRVRIDRLLVAPGATVRWSGNIASVQIGSLVAERPLTATAPFTVEIRGTPHHAYSALRREAVPGAAGPPGANGRDGSISKVWHTPFGIRPIGREPAAAMHGESGESGKSGGPGGQGRSGGMVMAAGIELLAMEGFGPGSLRLDVEAGRGEQGAAGGNGGSGGVGGCGAPGWAHPLDDNTAGHGGDGGAGGAGGTGGRGGTGGLASHIFLTLPYDRHHALELHARPAAGGAPGPGGCGGRGGRAGAGGRGADRPFLGRKPDGVAGKHGAPGKPGRAGAAGREGEPPPLWVHTISGPSCALRRRAASVS